MIMPFPVAMLAAAAGAEHGEQESLSEVLMHHISNHDYPSLAQWGMSKGVVMMPHRGDVSDRCDRLVL